MDQNVVENINTESNKSRKLIPFWQTLLMSLGSLMVILSYLTLYFSPYKYEFTSMSRLMLPLPANEVVLLSLQSLGFILAPILFAFPMRIKKAKLLFIPCAAVLVVSVLWFSFFGIAYALLVSVISAILAACGIGAGYLLRNAKKEIFRDNISKKIISTVSGSIILLIPILFILNGFLIHAFGNPIGNFFAHRKMETYVAKNYAEYDFQVSYPQFWQSRDDMTGIGSYVSDAVSRIDGNIQMQIAVHNNDGIYYGDSYSNVIRYMLTPLFREEFGDHYSDIALWSENSMDRRVSSPRWHRARIEFLAENFNPDALADIIIKCRNIVEMKDFKFTQYDFNFRKGDIELRIDDLKPEYINDELIVVIEDIVNDNKNFDNKGRYKDTGIWYYFYTYQTP